MVATCQRLNHDCRWPYKPDPCTCVRSKILEEPAGTHKSAKTHAGETPRQAVAGKLVRGITAGNTKRTLREAAAAV